MLSLIRLAHDEKVNCKMKTFAVLFVVVAMMSKGGIAQKDVSPLEGVLIRTAHNVEHAVAPLMSWGENGQHPENAAVVGTGFFINADGYFITAAHVADLWKPNSAQLSIMTRQNSGDAAGQWFDVIEKDTAHDLALCKMKVSLKNLLMVNRMIGKGKALPNAESGITIATLGISTQPTQTGRFIAIAGFPLGSWNPSIQLGTIASTTTVNPNIEGVPGGRKQLLQISVSGNKGNSGSPVIELRTGKVIGVVVQVIPAPLYTAGPNNVPLAQSSGVMLAVPAVWVQELLKRHGITSNTILPTSKLP